MSDKNKLKIVFFGLGSIGRRHARLIHDNFGHSLYALRSNKSKIQKNSLGIKEIFSFEEVKQRKLDVAFITNPTSEHVKYAQYCAEQKMDLFIEKPLSHNKRGIDELAKTIKKNKIKSYTAYCLRFHPVIQWLKRYTKDKKPIHVRVNASSYLPDWRPGSSLNYYSAHKSMGGGVILDLSHEIDYLYFLFGTPMSIKVNSKRVSSVTADAEDFADMLVEWKEMFGNVHISFLSRLRRREIILDFKDNTVVADLIRNSIKIIGEGEKEINFRSDMDSIYLAQLKYFLNKKGDMNNIEESMKVFKIITRIKGAAG